MKHTLLYEAFLAMDSDVAKHVFRVEASQLPPRHKGVCLVPCGAKIVLRAGQSPRRPCFGGQDIDLAPFFGSPGNALPQKRGGV